MNARALLAACLLAAALAPAAAESQSKTFSPFTRLEDETYFSGSVDVGSGNSYVVSVTASAEVLDDFEANQEGDKLELESEDDLSSSTTGNASYAVTVPANALEEISASGAGVLTIKGAALSTQGFRLNSEGAGRVDVTDLAAPQLRVDTSGLSTIVITGTPQTVEVNADGGDNTYISGVTGSVQIRSDGQGSIYIIAANDQVQISGTVGQTSVYYTQGSCSISGCKQTAISLPAPGSLSPTMAPRYTLPGGGSNDGGGGSGLNIDGRTINTGR